MGAREVREPIHAPLNPKDISIKGPRQHTDAAKAVNTAPRPSQRILLDKVSGCVFMAKLLLI